MKKMQIMFLSLVTLVVLFSGQVLAYPDVFVDQLGVHFDLSPSSDSELNYLPLDPVADYYRITLSYDMQDNEITGRYGKDYFTLKIGSQVAEIKGKREILDAPVLIVNGHTLVPKTFIQNLIKVDFKWRPTPPRIIFKERSIEECVDVTLYMNKDRYNFGDSIVITMMIKNVTQQEVKVPLRSSQIYDLHLSYKGNEIWRWSRDKMFTSAMTDYVLNPGESKIYNITLPRDLILTPAQYQIIGTFMSKPTVESSVYFLEIQ